MFHNFRPSFNRAFVRDTLQGPAKRLRPGLVKFVSAVAYKSCLNLPAAFTQPGRSLLADPCTRFPSLHVLSCVQSEISLCTQLKKWRDGNLVNVEWELTVNPASSLWSLRLKKRGYLAYHKAPSIRWQILQSQLI